MHWKQQIFRDCGIEDWARQLKENYMQQAFLHLDEIAVLSARKEPLIQLAKYLVQRDK
jgi:geranylgeranyl diphosphate synthase, type II